MKRHPYLSGAEAQGLENLRLGQIPALAHSSRNLFRWVLRTLSTTSRQSPSRFCRKLRADGYHGESSTPASIANPASPPATPTPQRVQAKPLCIIHVFRNKGSMRMGHDALQLRKAHRMLVYPLRSHRQLTTASGLPEHKLWIIEISLLRACRYSAHQFF